ncbi:hypothetical protein CON11_26415 [Priestia megaterium]|uniref:DUF4231 domain-containing protein n=1 Tax=Priestia megaterium TaxID=1404 RepID=UPI000BEE6309|nr:DUF4231 domain-containing protein [Priestia megaterium]PEC41862.1 hypothetical protein CON11_26415 [Priestia megaterium]
MSEFHKKVEDSFSMYYHAANKISIQSQKRYMSAFKGSLIPLIIASMISCITGVLNNNAIVTSLNMIIILCIIISVVCTAIVHNSKLQKLWYDGRAVAESLKTMSWKYITCTTPYDSNKNLKEASDTYSRSLEIIFENHKEIMNRVNLSSPDMITCEMENLRGLDLSQKRMLYIEQRIKQQLQWYDNNSKNNLKFKSFWFIAAVGLQILALISVFYVYSNSSLSSDLVGLFSAASTSIISWIQVKRYQELHEAYSTTALELSYIYNKGKQINNEDLQEFVDDAEKAISREHTLWIARRDHTKLDKLIK